MLMLYGEKRTNEEIIKFIHNYVNSVKNEKRDRYHVILSLLPEENRYILDYGCGWGHYAIAARDKGNRVMAIDLSQNEIEICNLIWGKQHNVSFENKMINTFESSIFNCVLSNQVIEHVHNVGNYLSEINRVLELGGKLIISLPNVLNPRHFIGLLRSDLENKLKKQSEHYLNKYDKTRDHINAWDPYHFVALLASVGFLLERYIPSEGIPFPFKKPFAQYWYVNNRRFRNLSYTMVFSFRKISNIIVGAND